jgi:nucleotide-binding universal stress UspA family protein
MENKMKIMVCYDCSNEAKEEVLKEAGKQARVFNGEVIVVSSHVIDDQYYPKLIEPTEQGLKEAQAFFNELGIPCKTILDYRSVDTDAGEQLLCIAKKEGVGEIIVGIRNRSKIELLLGSVAQFIILHANCPVIGVKKKSEF